MSFYETRIYIQVKEPKDWDRFRQLKSDIVYESGLAFPNGKTPPLTDSICLSLRPDDLIQLVETLADALEDKGIIVADTADTNTDPSNFCVCYIGENVHIFEEDMFDYDDIDDSMVFNTSVEKVDKWLKFAGEKISENEAELLAAFGFTDTKKLVKKEKKVSKPQYAYVEAKNPTEWKVTKLKNGTLKIVDYLGEYCEEQDFIIPSKINGERVTVIGKNFFQYETVNSVTISSGIIEIEKNAFEGVTLNYINFEEGLEIIGNECFHSINGVKELVLPASLKTIKSYGFDEASDLEKVTILNPNFEFCYNDIGSPFAELYSGKITFCGYKGSTTETFATMKRMDSDELEAEYLLGIKVEFEEIE